MLAMSSGQPGTIWKSHSVPVALSVMPTRNQLWKTSRSTSASGRRVIRLLLRQQRPGVIRAAGSYITSPLGDVTGLTRGFLGPALTLQHLPGDPLRGERGGHHGAS